MSVNTTELLLLLIVALLLTAVCLLIVLLARQGRNGEEDARRINELGNAILDEIENERAAGLQAEQQGREYLLASLDRSLTRQDETIERLRSAVSVALAGQQASNERQLAEIRRTVDEKLTETLSRSLNESFLQVSRKLEEVYRGLGEMHEMAGGITELKKVLTNVKTRGIWGEKQLGELLAAVLAPAQYGQNVEVVPGSGERVEYAIRLPGRGSDPVWLPVDSKFPQEAYLRLTDAGAAGDKAAEDAARKDLRRVLLTEGKRIAKYIRLPYSTDFAVMFLPVEGLYAEVVRCEGLTEELQRECRVTVAGPSTFAALLNSLQMGFRTLAIEQRSAEVWQLLGAVRRDFGRFNAALDKACTQLGAVSDTLDEARRSTGRLHRELGALSDEGTGE